MWRKAGNKMKLKDGLRTIFLAGVGAVAITGEKASVIIDDLVKKGELTVEEGKVLNEEFKKKAKENLNPENIQKNVKEVIASIDEMTKEQRDAIRSMLDRLDKKEKEEAKEEAEELVDAIVEDAVGDDTVDAPDAEIDQDRFPALRRFSFLSGMIFFSPLIAFKKSSTVLNLIWRSIAMAFRTALLRFSGISGSIS